MARPSTWLLAAALVLAAACTANAQLQARRLIQNQGPYDDVAASVQIQQVFEEAVTANVANCDATPTDGLSIGPSTKQRPYIVPVDCGVTTTSILTVGDDIGGYRLVGIPDGMGAYRLSEEKDDDKSGGNRKMGGDKGKGKGNDDEEEGDDIVLLANHELQETVGANRSHGGKGAFISKWTIDAKTLQVKKGEDLIKEVYNWNWLTMQYEKIEKYAFRRFCSADLADQRAYRWGNFGTKDRIFTNGEETGITGRAYAHIATGKHKGKSYQLYNFGWDSWENIVCRPFTSRKTVCIGLDDGGTPHQGVYVYVGDKKWNKNGKLDPVDAAGLKEGKLYGIQLEGLTVESSTSLPPNNQKEFDFKLVDVTPKTVAPVIVSGAVSEAVWQTYVNDTSRGIMNWARPEDGAWDPNRPTDFYFLTTASLAGVTKMWRLRFKNLMDVTQGGKATIIVNGLRGTDANPNATPPTPAIPNQAGPVMMDNLVVHKGFTYMQEDPGNAAILARIWEQDLSKASPAGLKVLARHDPCLYDKDVARPFITADEESSGIISMDGLLKGRYSKDCFMVAQQTHLKLDNTTVAAPLYPENVGGVPDNLSELVEGGQLLLMCKNARKCSG